jgi:Zn-dependent protease with chaperone function
MSLATEYFDTEQHIRRAHQARLLAVGMLLAGVFLVFCYALVTALGVAAWLVIALAAGVNARQLVAAKRGYTPTPTGTSAADHPRLAKAIDRVTTAFDISNPDVHVVDADHVTAAAGGLTPHSAQVVVSQTALTDLSDSILEGIIAHELAHLKNYHTLLGNLLRIPATIVSVGVAACLLGTVVTVVIPGLTVVQFETTLGVTGVSVLYTVLHAAVLREREYLADLTAAEYLADADQYEAVLRTVSSIDDTDRSLFRVHPPLEARIQSGRTVVE